MPDKRHHQDKEDNKDIGEDKKGPYTIEKTSTHDNTSLMLVYGSLCLLSIEVR